MKDNERSMHLQITPVSFAKRTLAGLVLESNRRSSSLPSMISPTIDTRTSHASSTSSVTLPDGERKCTAHWPKTRAHSTTACRTSCPESCAPGHLTSLARPNPDVITPHMYPCRQISPFPIKRTLACKESRAWRSPGTWPIRRARFHEQ